MRIEKDKNGKMFNYYDVNGNYIIIPKSKIIERIFKIKDVKKMYRECNKIFLKTKKRFTIYSCLILFLLFLITANNFLPITILPFKLGLLCHGSEVILALLAGIDYLKLEPLQKVVDMLKEDIKLDEERKNNVAIVNEKEDSKSETDVKKQTNQYNYSGSNNDRGNIIYPNFGGNKKHK